MKRTWCLTCGIKNANHFVWLTISYDLCCVGFSSQFVNFAHLKYSTCAFEYNAVVIFVFPMAIKQRSLMETFLERILWNLCQPMTILGIVFCNRILDYCSDNKFIDYGQHRRTSHDDDIFKWFPRHPKFHPAEKVEYRGHCIIQTDLLN